ncbi:histidine kinase [Streptomyces sp. MST-110588]|uniref:sensor histidine kinase n=1 Tax=Streptomyces sp. MST-110588 TaxID=2833628 RepID=UPI001F5C3683|nr:histidine kinase [Streptomyces sp. MST-110588]UNO42272.1 sensor histidine kinase [Streptomyces sp. MST-110588]
MTRRGMRHMWRALVGAGLVTMELPFVALTGLAMLCVYLWPRGRRAVLRPVMSVARWLVEIERRRLRRGGADFASEYDDARALGYLASRAALGLLGVLVLVCVTAGATVVLWASTAWMFDEIRHPVDVAETGFGAALLLFISVQGMFGVSTMEARLARHFLGPSHARELERRVEELASSRAGVVAAVNDERRRIERDLHDGVQQRLVALGILLGRALRSKDQARATALLQQAHEESRRALTELREVAWRVYPTVLDEAGLRAALETVAERSAIPVRLCYRLNRDPDTAVATVAYFVVCEAVTNAVKHSGAGLITVCVDRKESILFLHIEDDGTGGANASGSGLFGLSRRVAALDGRLRVSSPVGGPTTVTAELPCA